MKAPRTRFHLLVAGAAVTLLTALSSPAAERLLLESQPGSTVTVDGTSTIHDWTVKSGIIGGQMELDADVLKDPAKASKANPKVEVTIPTMSLKSDNRKMDSVMMQALKNDKRQNPAIKYKLLEMSVKEPPKSPEGPVVLDTKGELTVAGVTRTNSMVVTLQKLDGNKVKATGSADLKMTDFKITPPSIIGMLNTGDDVKVKFEWITAPAAATKTADSK